MRRWKTEIHMVDKGDKSSPTTSYRTFGLLDVKEILVRMRTKDAVEGKPKRSLAPISRYVLEELTQEFLREHSPDCELVKIVIEDSKHGL